MIKIGGLPRYWAPGEWNFCCDVCGFEYKSSMGRMRWDGLIVCPPCFERRHPQDFVRPRKDAINIPWTRNCEVDTFIGGAATVDLLARNGGISSVSTVSDPSNPALTEIPGAEANLLEMVPSTFSLTVSDEGTPANDLDITSDWAAMSRFWTYTSPTPKILRQSDGSTIAYCPHNLWPYSEAFDNADWTKTLCTITTGQTPPPSGPTTAVKLVEQAILSSPHYISQRNITYVQGRRYRLSCYAKAAERFVLKLQGPGTAGFFDGVFNLNTGAVEPPPASSQNVGGTGFFGATIESVGNGWYRCAIIYEAQNAFWPFIVLCNGTNGNTTYLGDGTSGLYIAGAQLSYAPVETSTYIYSNGTPEYALPIEWDTDTTCFGHLREPASQNLCLYSNDFTNAAWTKSNVTAAYKSGGATTPGGDSRGASLLTASSNNGTVTQAITSSSSARVTSMYVRRNTGAGDIEMTDDNGSTWTPVTVTSSWTRVSIGPNTLANPTVGIRITTSGDAIEVIWFQHETGSFVTSPIETLGTAQTRTIDDITAATSTYPHSATVNTAYIDYRPKDVATASAELRLDALPIPPNERIDLGHTAAGAAQLAVTDGGAAQTAPLTQGTVSANANKKLAAKWKANEFRLSNAGATVATDASGTLPTVDTLQIGATGGAHGHLRHLWIVPVDKTDGQIEALATSGPA